jgi:uncharacterized protein
MRVKVEEIQEQGLVLSESIKPNVLSEALAESEGFKLVGADKLSAEFKKVSGRIHLKGSLDVDLSCPCKRCTKDVAMKVPLRFQLRMVTEEAPRHDDAEGDGDDDGEGGLAGSFELDAVDAEPFDGKTIDLDPIVREQVLLALPVSVLCKEDCKGLCPECGQDLNERECGHKPANPLNPFAKLKDLKLKS